METADVSGFGREDSCHSWVRQLACVQLAQLRLFSFNDIVHQPLTGKAGLKIQFHICRFDELHRRTSSTAIAAQQSMLR